jgi:hypothetical protein
MAKKLKISRRRLQDLQDEVERASDQQLERYTNLITPSLQKAAETFRLDPHSDWHCQILVRILARLIFSKGKKGRPRDTFKWHPQREHHLGYHFYELKQEKPKIKYSEAARIIMKRYPDEYADCKEMALRQRLRGAYEFFEECRQQDEAVDEWIRQMETDKEERERHEAKMREAIEAAEEQERGQNVVALNRGAGKTL